MASGTMIRRWTFVTFAHSLLTVVVVCDVIAIQWFVDEESPAQTLIGNLRQALRSQMDREVLAQSQFSLLPRPNQNLSGFTVDRIGGGGGAGGGGGDDLLTTSTPLDRESICPLHRHAECTVDLNVGLIRSAQLETIVNVKVVVLDVNDNAPLFSQPQYEVRISELSASGSTFALPVATDLDSPRFGVQRYRLRSNFQEFQLKLVNGSQQGSASSSPAPYLALTRKLRLDPEPYTLILEAFDWGTPPMSGSATVVVSVEDANDHPPVFPDETVRIEVREDHPVDSAVYRLSATDGDRGLNAEIGYGFVPESSLFQGHNFRVDRTSGEIFLRHPLDFETENSFQLAVMAVDSGTEPLTGHQTIVVQVTDVNDNSPQLTINTLTSHTQPRNYRGLGAEVAENSPAGSFVAHLSAYDADSGTNGQVSCRLLDEDAVPFSLDLMAAGQYKLTTAANVDYETDHTLVVAVECSDNGDPTMTSRQNISIDVIDLNDNTPEFSQDHYDVTVPENNAPDAELLRIAVRDRDSGANAQLVYSIVEPFAAQFVYVDANASAVRAGAVLDHETVQSLDFTIVVVDSGTPVNSASARVTVRVEDANDEEPRFAHNSYEFSIAENSPPGTVVGFVSAVDRDSPPLNRFVYKIIDAFSHGTTELFAIDPRSGKIIAKRVFDRESRAEYRCTVSAIDQDKPALRSEAIVRIAVVDENDNYPVIAYPSGAGAASDTPPSGSASSSSFSSSEPRNNSFAVSSAVPRGFSVLRVIAQDADEGDNARLTFGLANGYDLFAIDPKTGVLATRREFHGLVSYEQHRIRVTVHDSGFPPKTSTVDIVIVVDPAIAFEDTTTATADEEGGDSHEFGAYVPASRGGGGGGNMAGQTADTDHLFIAISVSCVVAAFLIVILIVVLAVKIFERRNRPQAVYHCREQERKVLDTMAANDCERKELDESMKNYPLKSVNSNLSLSSQRIKRDGNCDKGGATGEGSRGGRGATGKGGRCTDHHRNDYVGALETKLLGEFRENDGTMGVDVENSSLTDVSGDSGLGGGGGGGWGGPGPGEDFRRLELFGHHHHHHHHHLPSVPASHRIHHHIHNHHQLRNDAVGSRQSYSLPRNNGLDQQLTSTFKGLSQSTNQIVPPAATIPYYDDDDYYYDPPPLPPPPMEEEPPPPSPPPSRVLRDHHHGSMLQYCAQPQMLLCPFNNNKDLRSPTTTTTKKKAKTTPGDSLVDEIRKYKTRMATFPVAHSSALRDHHRQVHNNKSGGQTRHLFQAQEDYEDKGEEEEGGDDEFDDDGLSMRWDGIR